MRPLPHVSCERQSAAQPSPPLRFAVVADFSGREIDDAVAARLVRLAVAPSSRHRRCCCRRRRPRRASDRPRGSPHVLALAAWASSRHRVGVAVVAHLAASRVDGRRCRRSRSSDSRPSTRRPRHGCRRRRPRSSDHSRRVVVDDAVATRFVGVAVGRAPVTPVMVPVVAHLVSRVAFAEGSIHDAVAAGLVRAAVGRAGIAVAHVPVVALLLGVYGAVPAGILTAAGAVAGTLGALGAEDPQVQVELTGLRQVASATPRSAPARRTRRCVAVTAAPPGRERRAQGRGWGRPTPPPRPIG